jgi:2-polyprenyl-3-methyl-5-hydroxy-6-metoxy-1,4-benzoquinol methylase
MTNRKERRAARKPSKPPNPPAPGAGGERSIVTALLGRGKELLANHDDEAALDVACRAVLMEETPGTKAFFIQCVKGWSYFPGAEEMQGTLARALREAWTWPTDILGTVLGILQKDRVIGPALQRARQAWPRRASAQELFGSAGLATIVNHSLLLALLESVQVPDLGFERLFATIRCALLDAATAGGGIADDGIVRFAAALAQQCFINEYVFDLTDEERVRVDKLRDAICAAFASDAPVAPLWLAAIAAYVRLDMLPAKPLRPKPWPSSLSALLDQQVREPEALLRLRASIPRLTSITDDVSRAVRDQYEEHPYPRWVRIPAGISPVAIEAYLQREFPRQASGVRRPRSRLDILVAGCGTGQQSIYFAQRYEGAKVLAVDLSLSSLSYAKARTSAAGLTNIDYAQADILALGNLGKTFDVIVSSGVLHHLADPAVGWRVLASLLRPDGFMYVGLYSEKARRNITAARKWIAERGFEATADGIRKCRQELVERADPAWKSILTMVDFFSASECRDLLFHVQEHRFTLPQIAAFLDENELKFVGFNIGRKILRQFRSRFPADRDLSDLRHWHEFETENPDTFIDMYQFWIRKPGG